MEYFTEKGESGLTISPRSNDVQPELEKSPLEHATRLVHYRRDEIEERDLIVPRVNLHPWVMICSAPDQHQCQTLGFICDDTGVMRLRSDSNPSDAEKTRCTVSCQCYNVDDHIWRSTGKCCLVLISPDAAAVLNGYSKRNRRDEIKDHGLIEARAVTHPYVMVCTIHEQQRCKDLGFICDDTGTIRLASRTVSDADKTLCAQSCQCFNVVTDQLENTAKDDIKWISPEAAAVLNGFESKRSEIKNHDLIEARVEVHPFAMVCRLADQPRCKDLGFICDDTGSLRSMSDTVSNADKSLCAQSCKCLNVETATEKSTAWFSIKWISREAAAVLNGYESKRDEIKDHGLIEARASEIHPFIMLCRLGDQQPCQDMGFICDDTGSMRQRTRTVLNIDKTYCAQWCQCVDVRNAGAISTPWYSITWISRGAAAVLNGFS